MTKKLDLRQLDRRQFLTHAAGMGAGAAAMAALGGGSAQAAANELRILFAGGT